MHATIPVSEIMVRDVVTTSTDATVTDAATLMRDEGVSSVLVTRDGDPVGIVTEGDFATHLCDREEVGRAELADVMSSPLTTIDPDASILEAVSTLRNADLEHLPVVEGDEESTDDGHLVGIVTTIELSYFLPHLVRPTTEDHPRPPRRRVRTDTQYERDDWSFEYRGEDESTVSVGDTATFSKAITQADVESFAELSGDTNRLHLDEGYAAGTRFGERIVHGTLVAGLVSAALARLPGLTIYLSQELSFLGPVPLGERVTAVCEIADDLGRAKYRVLTRVEDEDGETVVDGEAVVLVDELPPEAATGAGEVA